MSQQAWHVKEASFLKAINAKHRPRFDLSSVTVTTAELLKNFSDIYNKKKKRQTSKSIVLVLHFNPWVEASAGGLQVPEGLHSPVAK
jgi:hypothetical protein